MKRLVFIFLAVCAMFSLAQAQVGVMRSSGISSVQKVHKPTRTYEWENFILANYQYGFENQHAIGLTYGRVKLFGWYVNASFGFGSHYHSDHKAVDSYYSNPGFVKGKSLEISNGKYVLPNYTGKESRNQLAFSGGAVARLVIPLYVYVGLGYCYHSVIAESTDYGWIYMTDPTYKSFGHGMVLEGGLQGNIKGFTLSLGYSFLSNFDLDNNRGVMNEIRVGIGYTFNDRKK